MNRLALAFGCISLITGVGLRQLSAAGQRPPEEAFSVRLELQPVTGPLRPRTINARVTVRNNGPRPVTVENAGNRMVTSFLVQDRWLDILKPTCNDKIDYEPGAPKTLGPGETLTYTAPGLQFITGTGLCEYSFRVNQPYHVVAVYRPHGDKGPGFTSQQEEVVIPDIR